MKIAAVQMISGPEVAGELDPARIAEVRGNLLTLKHRKI
jgi:hypothetical protein